MYNELIASRLVRFMKAVGSLGYSTSPLKGV